MSSAKTIVAEFIQKLIGRAYYGIKGEKPIAVIAALKYLHENKIVGKRLLVLFDGPDAENIRRIFVDLAKRYSSISEPSTSWNTITGKNRELQNAIQQFSNVNEAFSKLTQEEIGSLLEGYIRRLEKTAKPSHIVKAGKMQNAPLTYPFRKSNKPLVSLMEEIGIKDPRVTCLLEFGKGIRPRELFPVLCEDAALLIEKNLFAFALAAVLDRGTKSEVIWTIPYYLQKRIGDLSPFSLVNMSVEELERIFRSLPVKPRYITDAPRTVKELSRIVVREYDGDVKRIWQDKTAAFVKATFQRIYGVGPGIASMIVLLLEKCFKIRFTDLDHRTMDVKPDVHIVRIFQRLGFISVSDEAEALEAARKLHPEYPGALDAPAWVIGKKWCTSFAPLCPKCPLNNVCPKNTL